MENNIEECCICGDNLDKKFSITLSCNHKYHYECISKTFISRKSEKSVRRCPLCNSKCDLLPVVNGLKRPIKHIHYVHIYPAEFKNIPCQYLIDVF